MNDDLDFLCKYPHSNDLSLNFLFSFIFLVNELAGTNDPPPNDAIDEQDSFHQNLSSSDDAMNQLGNSKLEFVIIHKSFFLYKYDSIL